MTKHSIKYPPIPEIPVPADFSQFDSVEDIIRDASQWGLLDELRAKLSLGRTAEQESAQRMARDIAFELAGATNRALAVDVLLHATGIAEFGTSNLRNYAARHGICHEWFRQQVLNTCRRLNLPLPQAFHKEDSHAA